MKKILLALFVMVLAISIGGVAYAAHGEGANTATNPLAISVGVVTTCDIVANSVTFPGYDGMAAVSAVGGIDVRCTAETPYHITLNEGANLATGIRNLVSGSNSIPYTLNDPADSAEWGDSDFAATYLAGVSVADVGNGTSQSHQVNGHIAAGTFVPVAVTTDPYDDSVIATVHY